MGWKVEGLLLTADQVRLPRSHGQVFTAGGRGCDHRQPVNAEEEEGGSGAWDCVLLPAGKPARVLLPAGKPAQIARDSQYAIPYAWSPSIAAITGIAPQPPLLCLNPSDLPYGCAVEFHEPTEASSLPEGLAVQSTRPQEGWHWSWLPPLLPRLLPTWFPQHPSSCARSACRLPPTPLARDRVGRGTSKAPP